LDILKILNNCKLYFHEKDLIKPDKNNRKVYDDGKLVNQGIYGSINTLKL